MKKILIIQESLGGGGAERVLNDILNDIDYSKYQIDLALIHDDDSIYTKNLDKNVNVKIFLPKCIFKGNFLKKIYNRYKIWYVKNAYKYIPQKLGNDYDIEIAFLEGPCTQILARKERTKAKKIAWVHTDVTKLRRISKKEERDAYEKIDKIICVSKDAKNSFLEFYPEFEEKTDVIYNLIDIENIKKLGGEILSEEIDENTLIGVGRLSNQKRFDKLVKAHKLLLDEGVKNNIIIIGEGDKREELEKLVEELGVSDTVKIKGFSNNPYKYIKNSKLFVMCSDMEGFSLVVAESLILGKAIVSTKCAGPMEILGESEYGVIIEEDTIECLKNNIKDLLLNKEKLDYYEKKAVQRVKMFDKEIFWNNFYKLINDTESK